MSFWQLIFFKLKASTIQVLQLLAAKCCHRLIFVAHLQQSYLLMAFCSKSVWFIHIVRSKTLHDFLDVSVMVSPFWFKGVLCPAAKSVRFHLVQISSKQSIKRLERGDLFLHLYIVGRQWTPSLCISFFLSSSEALNLSSAWLKGQSLILSPSLWHFCS